MGTEGRRPRVGDRVRIRAGIGARVDPDSWPHYPEEEGCLGTVAAVRPLMGGPHHAYLVMLDAPHPVVILGGAPLELAFRHYAADELEPAE